MDYQTLKNELDGLYAQLNEPRGIVPQWAETGLTSEGISDLEKGLGVKIPASMQRALAVVSGVSHESPLYLGSLFSSLQKQVLRQAKGDLTRDDFLDDLEICYVASPSEWQKEELQALRAVDDEELQMTEPHERIAIDADMEWLSDQRFVLVGTTYSQSLYLNLIDEVQSSYGAFYNLKILTPFAVLYKVAESYDDLLKKIHVSLQHKLKHQADD